MISMIIKPKCGKNCGKKSACSARAFRVQKTADVSTDGFVYQSAHFVIENIKSAS